MWLFKSPFEFCFCSFNLSLSFQAKSNKKWCLQFGIFNLRERLQNIIEIGLNKYGVIIEKHSLRKKYLERNNWQAHFCFLQMYMSKQLLSKFEGNQTDFLWLPKGTQTMAIHFIFLFLVQCDGQCYELSFRIGV